MTKLTSATHRRNSNKQRYHDFTRLASHLCSRLQRNRPEAAKCHDFMTWKIVHESSGKFKNFKIPKFHESSKISWFQSFMNVHVFMTSKFHDFSWIFMISWLNEASHSCHCDGLLMRAHGLTFYLATAAFLGAATLQVFATRRTVATVTAFWELVTQTLLRCHAL